MRLASLLTLTAALSFAAPSPAAAQAVQPEDAGAAYERQAVGVRHLVVPRRDGATSDSEGHLLIDGNWDDGKWDAFAGRDHHPIDEEAFFRIVGRDDLLLRYHRKATVKKSLTFGGGALIFGGLLFAAVTAELRYGGGAQPAIGCEETGCPSADSRAPSPVWGLAIAGTGLVSTIIGHLLDPTPIDAAQADALARDYDQLLKSRSGISETAARD